MSIMTCMVNAPSAQKTEAVLINSCVKILLFFLCSLRQITFLQDIFFGIARFFEFCNNVSILCKYIIILSLSFVREDYTIGYKRSYQSYRKRKNEAAKSFKRKNKPQIFSKLPDKSIRLKFDADIELCIKNEPRVKSHYVFINFSAVPRRNIIFLFHCVIIVSMLPYQRQQKRS